MKYSPRYQAIKVSELSANVVPAGARCGFKIELHLKGRKKPVVIIEAGSYSRGPLGFRIKAIGMAVVSYVNDGDAIYLIKSRPRTKTPPKA